MVQGALIGRPFLWRGDNRLAIAPLLAASVEDQPSPYGDGGIP